MNPEELKHIAVLQAMDDDALARLAAALEEKDYADGQTVFAEGDPGDSMYFIVKGCIRIEKRAQAASARQQDPHRARSRRLFRGDGAAGPETAVSLGGCGGRRQDPPPLQGGV